MKIKDIINEGISNVLYHCTSFQNAIKVLDNNVLGKGSVPVSFARSAYGAYHRDNKLIGVIFEIDGRKLAYNYSGSPVGGENWDYDPDEYNKTDKSTWEMQGKTGQFEDRVNGPIKNFSKFVSRAIVYVPKEYIKSQSKDEMGDSYNESMQFVIKCIELLELKNIPVQYIIKESQLARNASAAAVQKGDFIKMLLQYDSSLSQYLPSYMQPNAKWVAIGTMSYSDEDDDFEPVNIKFLAPLSSNKGKLVQYAIAAFKKQNSIEPGDGLYISYIESLDVYSKYFEIDRFV